MPRRHRNNSYIDSIDINSLSFEYLSTFTVSDLRRLCGRYFIHAPRSLRKTNLINHILQHFDDMSSSDFNMPPEHFHPPRRFHRNHRQRRNRKQRKLIQIIRLFSGGENETEIHIVWETLEHKKLGVRIFNQISEIEKMKQVQLMVDRNDESKNNDAECPVCMSEFNNAVTTTCQHSFCFECLEQWKTVSNTCPLCRVSLSNENNTEANLSLILSYMDIINIILEHKRPDEENKLTIEILEKIKHVFTNLIENNEF